jgi:hypothetical protein
MLTDLQRVDTRDRTYGIALRYTRTYLPFELHLIDFSHDTFTGTSIAKNFSSDVRIIDPDRGTDREVRIWMNNPLRYAGRTFYQASYKPDGTGTVLQVVRNPGWLMPYLSCVLVTLGMTWHFLQSITVFLRRRMREGAVVLEGSASPERQGALKLTIAAGIAGLLIAFSGLMRPPPRRISTRAGSRACRCRPAVASSPWTRLLARCSCSEAESRPLSQRTERSARFVF